MNEFPYAHAFLDIAAAQGIIKGSKTEDSLNESKKQRELHPMISLAYWPDGVGQVKVRLEKEVMAEHALKKVIGIDGNL